MNRPRLLVIMGASGDLRNGTAIVSSRVYRLCSQYSRRFETTVCLQGPTPVVGRPLPEDIGHLFVPHYTSAVDFVTKWRAVSRQFRSALKSTEVLLARMPFLETVEALRQSHGAKMLAYSLFIGEWAPAIQKRSRFARLVSRRIAQALTHFAAQRADVVLTHGTALAQELGISGIAARPVIQGNLEPEDFLPLRSRFREDPIQILTVARLVATKNIRSIIEALPLLERNSVSCQLKVAGEGPQRHELEQLTQNSGLEGSVTFLGWVDGVARMRELYSQSDVFVLPTTSEAVSTAVLEAMAAGLPVVVPAVGGLMDIIQKGVNCIVLADPGPGAIADAIEELRADPNLAASLGMKGMESVRPFLHSNWVDHFYEMFVSDMAQVAGSG